MWKNFDRRSAIYHSRSRIENFQFAVTLRTISSLLKVTIFEKSASTREDDCADEEDFTELVMIRWQEKILSRYEIELYKEIENCVTDVQKRYHSWIMESGLEEVRRASATIFTYVHEDNFVLPEILVQGATPWNNRNTPNEDGDSEAMYVFAEINPNTLLFAVKWRKRDNSLEVYPDFNDFDKNPYFIEIDSNYRHLFSYAVKNNSKTVDLAILDNLNLPQIRSTDKNLQGAFNMPPKCCSRAVILIEFRDAEGFEYDSIYIKYQFQLPDNVKMEDGTSPCGTTHASKKRNGVWIFGYCVQLTVVCDKSFNQQQAIHVFFEVVSIDCWDRERNEGFGYLKIPICSGRMQRTVKCYRINYGFLEKTQRFFIGGRRKFDFEHFNRGIEEFLNRYGTKVISAGVLRMHFSILTQKNDQIHFKVRKGIVPKGKGISLHDVVNEYLEARRRLTATMDL